MQIRNRLFPYPVLNHNSNYSSYSELRFELLFDEEETDSEYILNNIRYETDSNYIKKLITDGLLDVVCIIECSYTVYRKSFILTENIGKDIVLNKNDFSERVIISMFAYAKEDISIESDEFDEDYKGISFQIDKNDILAANDGYAIYFRHEQDEDNLARSIFNIINDHQLNDETYKVEIESERKINIYLSDEEYKNYRIIYSVPAYKEVFFSILLVPVLSEAISKCIEDVKANPELDLDDLENRYIWFRSISNGYNRLYGKDLDAETLSKSEPIQLAQALLGKPLRKSLLQLIEERNKVVMEGDENE